MKYKNKTTEQRSCRERLKWAAVIVAIFLLAVAVAAACTQGFKDGDPFNWFGTKDEQAEVADNLIVSPAEEQGVSLAMRTIARDEYDDYGIAPTALSAQTITATVTNSDGVEDESYSDGTWSYDWTTTNEGKDVTDYVTFSENGLTLTVSCIQAFTVQITVKYTSALTPIYLKPAVGSCTLDYAKPLKSVKVKILGTDAPVGMSERTGVAFPADYLMNDSEANQDEEWTKPMFEFSYVYGEGSCENPVSKVLLKAGVSRGSRYYSYFERVSQSSCNGKVPTVKFVETAAADLPKGVSTSVNDFYCALTGAAQADLHKLGIYRCFSLVGAIDMMEGKLFELRIHLNTQYGTQMEDNSFYIVYFQHHCSAPNVEVGMDNNHIYFSE